MLKKGLGCLLLSTFIIAGMTACNKEEGVPIETVQAYDYNNVSSDIEQAALDYALALIDKNYDKAYDMLYIPYDYFIDRESFSNTESEISYVCNNPIIIGLRSVNDRVTIEFGNKIGESYNKKNEYEGETIQGRESVEIKVTQDGNRPNMIVVDDDLVSDETISLRIPDGCDLWLDGKLLDDASRDNDGYYNIKHFADSETLTFTADCDVEKNKQIVLNIKAEVGEVIPDNSSLAPTTMHNDNKAWDYVWKTDRVTNDEAAEYIGKAFQHIFDSIILRQDFNRADFIGEVMSEKANLEKIKLGYMKCQETFQPTKNIIYTDLVCVEFVPYTEEECRKKEKVFEVTDKNTMVMYGTLKYTYIKYNHKEDITAIRNGDVSGEVVLTRDDDTWKLMSFDEKFLKNIT